jgi:hypothetical protein
MVRRIGLLEDPILQQVNLGLIYKNGPSVVGEVSSVRAKCHNRFDHGAVVLRFYL